jgi:hypothetical protein
MADDDTLEEAEETADGLKVPALGGDGVGPPRADVACISSRA